MDLNRKYSDHQKALIKASAASTEQARSANLADAKEIAGQIGGYQARLGAAASCAWSSANMGQQAGRPAAPARDPQ